MDGCQSLRPREANEAACHNEGFARQRTGRKRTPGCDCVHLHAAGLQRHHHLFSIIAGQPAVHSSRDDWANLLDSSQRLGRRTLQSIDRTVVIGEQRCHSRPHVPNA